MVLLGEPSRGRALIALHVVAEAHFSIWHWAVWAGGWDSCGRWLCSLGCWFIPVLLWGEDFVVSLSGGGWADVVDAFGAAS